MSNMTHGQKGEGRKEESNPYFCRISLPLFVAVAFCEKQTAIKMLRAPIFLCSPRSKVTNIYERMPHPFYS